MRKQDTAGASVGKSGATALDDEQAHGSRPLLLVLCDSDSASPLTLTPLRRIVRPLSRWG